MKVRRLCPSITPQAAFTAAVGQSSAAAGRQRLNHMSGLDAEEMQTDTSDMSPGVRGR